MHKETCRTHLHDQIIYNITSGALLQYFFHKIPADIMLYNLNSQSIFGYLCQNTEQPKLLVYHGFC